MKPERRWVMFFLIVGVILMTMAVAPASTEAGKGGGKGGSKPTYASYIKGNAVDVPGTTTPGEVLMGGGTDVDAAFVWMINRSGCGDFVVLGTSGKGEYNAYIYGLARKSACTKIDSVETLITSPSTTSSDLEVVANKIRNAEALFIRGGDQTTYADQWKGTAIEDAINELGARAPVGGTSAGLAILTQFYFKAAAGTVTSGEALADPYNSYIDLDQEFLTLPNMQGIIGDQHLVTRDRMGRLVAFLARIVQDGWAEHGKGIGVDEKTAVLVDENGQATVVGSGRAYFLGVSGAPEVCEPAAPLTYLNVPVYRLGAGAGSFDLPTWVGSGGTAYTLSATGGMLSSSQGSIY